MYDLFWHFIIDKDDYPEDIRLCFLQTKHPSTTIIGFRRDNVWYASLYGNLPTFYDDSGGIYHPDIIAWAYIPQKWLDQINYTRCNAFRPNCYGDGRDFCFGIKEIDECTCLGNKNKCNYY